MEDHKLFVLTAVERAQENARNGGYPFGAIIVKDGKVVGRSNVDDQAFDPTAHAELTSIRDACRNLKTYDLAGCKIYSSCHPCQMCLGAIKWVGIREIFYAMDKEDALAIGCVDDIFADDAVLLTKNKIPVDGVPEWMRDWYQHIE